MQRTSQSTANTALMFARSVQTFETEEFLDLIANFIHQQGVTLETLVKKSEELSKEYEKLEICGCDAESMGLYKLAAWQASRNCALFAASAAVLLGMGLRNDGLSTNAKICAKAAKYYVRKSQGLSTADIGTIE